MHTDKTIFVVDDDLEICSALKWLFESVNLNVEVYDSAKKFLANYHPTRKGCLVLDIRMPVMSGIELLEKLNAEQFHLPVIIITGHGDIPVAVKAMKTGAVDFIMKPINEKYLLETIYYYLDKSSRKMDIKLIVKNNLLTPREQQIINLIIDGKLNKEIAFTLRISISTVEAHRARIMRKFNAKNLAELIKRYFSIPDNYNA